jgi:hypothetical protein
MVFQARGFALVTVMFAMMIMMFLGAAAMFLSSTEIEIAGVEKIYKDTFYNADGGTNLAAEVLEQNANCGVGFSGNINANVDSLIAGTVYVEGGSEASKNVADGLGSRNFVYNLLVTTPSDANRDFSFPVTYDPVANPGGYHPVSNPRALHTNVTVGGDAVYGEGTAISMTAGYEGRGKGAAAGGARVNYGVMAQRRGLLNSNAVLWMGWRHVVGTEGPCIY